MPDLGPATFDPNAPLPANVDPSLAQAALAFQNSPQGQAFAAAPAQPITEAVAPPPVGINPYPTLAPAPVAPAGGAAPAPNSAPAAPVASPSQPAHHRASSGLPAGTLSSGPPPTAVADAGNQAPPPVADDQQTKLDTQAVTDLKREGQAKTDLANIQDILAQRELQQKQANEAELQKRTEEGNRFVSHAQDHMDRASDAYKQALDEDKTHTIFTGKSTWQKASAYIGMALGAFGAGFSAAGGHPTGNLALNQFNKMVDDNFSKQKENILNLKDSVAMARTGLTDAKDAKQALIYDLHAKVAATDDTALAYAKRQLAAQGASAAEIDNNAAVTALQQRQMDNKRIRTREAQEDYLKRLKGEAEANKDNATAAFYDRNRGRGTGGGGGAGGGKAEDKHLAAASKEIDKTVGKDPELKAQLTAAQALDRAMAAVQPGTTGFQLQTAVDEYIKSAAGGKVTRYQGDIFKSRLGGLFDTIAGNIARGSNGDYSAGQRATLAKAFSAAKAESDKGLTEARKRHEDALAANPVIARAHGGRDLIKSRLDDAYGAATPPAAAAPAVPPGAVMGKMNGKAGYVLNGQFHAL